MILHHPIRMKHIGTNLTAPVDILLTIFNYLSRLSLLLELALIQTSLQDLHRKSSILMLRTLVLTGHYNSGRKMGQSNGGIGLIDVLAARSTRSISIDSEILI